MLRHLISTCLLFIAITSISAQAPLNRKETKQLENLITDSPVFSRGFTGFALFDPATKQWLSQIQADKYFTPASNAKIITYWAAQELLRESAPIVHYKSEEDTLHLWGTGYPLLLHPYFVGYDTLGTWLTNRPESVWKIHNGHYRDKRFGEGWSWDDYPYGYQLEKAALPIYGNFVSVVKQGHLGPLQYSPTYFQDKAIYQDGPTLGREEDRNLFSFGPRALAAEKLDRTLAFRYSLSLLTQFLQDTFHREVYYDLDTIDLNQVETLRAPLPDTLHQRFLQDSDNFLAEQLILMASDERYGYLRTSDVLDYLRDTLLGVLPQPLDWVDGSGLSRYNQYTPQSVVQILDRLYHSVDHTELFNHFPKGGTSGTIERWYADPKGQAAVFAKTGTLRHVHCLSGYLQTRSGKVFIFIFMHNNFPGRINDLRREMQQIIYWLYDHLS